TMKSDLAGTVTVPWDAITAVSAAGPLYIGLKDGQTLVGAVTTLPDNGLEIATKTPGMVTATKGSVQFIRSSEEEALTKRRSTDTGIPAWLICGRAISMSGNANRSTSRDKIAV